MTKTDIREKVEDEVCIIMSLNNLKTILDH